MHMSRESTDPEVTFQASIFYHNNFGNGNGVFQMWLIDYDATGSGTWIVHCVM